MEFDLMHNNCCCCKVNSCIIFFFQEIQTTMQLRAISDTNLLTDQWAGRPPAICPGLKLLKRMRSRNR